MPWIQECVGESRRRPESERFFDWQGRRSRRYRCISSIQPDAVQSENKPLEARSDFPTGSYAEAWASFNLDWISGQDYLEKLAGGPLMNDWYAKLVRPPLTPPNWIFGPVWSVLYVMIAISLILYIKQTRQNPAWAYAIIIFHLITNFAWTGIFFNLQRPGWALLDIVLLDITLAILIIHFWQSARPCSILLWPYFAWVLFATYLNAGFYLLNRV